MRGNAAVGRSLRAPGPGPDLHPPAATALVTMDAVNGQFAGGGDPLLILASASPRRRQILSGSWTGRLRVSASGIEEDSPEAGETPANYAVRIAAAKCRAVADESAAGLVIAADTVVELSGVIMGKPSSADEARGMLTALRGLDHSVTTGLAVASPWLAELLVGHETSIVRMRRYSGEEIEAYIASGEPFDKAGGYAVQDIRFAPAEQVRGCYLNVVGLPLCGLSRLVADAGPGLDRMLLPGECASCPSTAGLKDRVAAT